MQRHFGSSRQMRTFDGLPRRVVRPSGAWSHRADGPYPGRWNFIALRRQYISDRTWFGFGLVVVGFGTLSITRGWMRLSALPLVLMGIALIWSGIRKAVLSADAGNEETRPSPPW